MRIEEHLLFFSILNTDIVVFDTAKQSLFFPLNFRFVRENFLILEKGKVVSPALVDKNQLKNQ